MVLICADPSEAVAAFFCSRLKMLRIDHQILDLRDATDTLSIQWSPHDGPPSGSISFADWTVNFDELTGVYFRNVPFDDLSDETGDPIDNAYPRIDPQIAAALNGLQCRVVNRPAATYSNRSKPYQSLMIRQIGFGIPKTLITNEPRAARQFYYECEGKVVRKSLSGVRSIVRRMNEKDLDGLALLEQGPAQFQEYLPGDNIRVHVVGERLFAVRIQCDAVDYRYAGQEGYARRMIPAKLHEDLETNCVRLAKEFGLAMAGIDLKETPAGEYFCFEVNTSPAFPFYESVARPVIADALAEFLAGSDGEK
jgi:glutathione synthase/RimK-type ligase-like ATP-grasp enzyme